MGRNFIRKQIQQVNFHVCRGKNVKKHVCTHVTLIICHDIINLFNSSDSYLLRQNTISIQCPFNDTSAATCNEIAFLIKRGLATLLSSESQMQQNCC